MAQHCCWCRKGEDEENGDTLERSGCRECHHFPCIAEKVGKGALAMAQRTAKRASLWYCERDMNVMHMGM
eukprot:evm.model.NODE_12981_length_6627_cov_50.234798.2